MTVNAFISLALASTAILFGRYAIAAKAAAPPTARLPIGGPNSEELLHAAIDSRNWLCATRDYQGQRYVT
jgi:hypothetical protein